MQRTDLIWLTQWDAADPEVAKAARLVERRGIARVGVLPAGQTRPEGCFLVVPDEEYGDAETYRALEVLCPPGLVIRWASEKPMISEAYAKQRGFTEQEIEKHLRPWITEQKLQADQLVRQAERDYVAALEAREAATKAALAPDVSPT